MEVSFGRCVRCKHSMRNRIRVLNFRWKQGGGVRCPHCKLAYVSGYDLPFPIGPIYWLCWVGLLVVLNVGGFIGLLLFTSVFLLIQLYLSPVVSYRSLRK